MNTVVTAGMSVLERASDQQIQIEQSKDKIDMLKGIAEVTVDGEKKETTNLRDNGDGTTTATLEDEKIEATFDKNGDLLDKTYTKTINGKECKITAIYDDTGTYVVDWKFEESALQDLYGDFLGTKWGELNITDGRADLSNFIDVIEANGGKILWKDVNGNELLNPGNKIMQGAFFEIVSGAGVSYGLPMIAVGQSGVSIMPQVSYDMGSLFDTFEECYDAYRGLKSPTEIGADFGRSVFGQKAMDYVRAGLKGIYTSNNLLGNAMVMGFNDAKPYIQNQLNRGINFINGAYSTMTSIFSSGLFIKSAVQITETYGFNANPITSEQYQKTLAMAFRGIFYGNDRFNRLNNAMTDFAFDLNNAIEGWDGAPASSGVPPQLQLFSTFMSEIDKRGWRKYFKI